MQLQMTILFSTPCHNYFAKANEDTFIGFTKQKERQG